MKKLFQALREKLVRGISEQFQNHRHDIPFLQGGFYGLTSGFRKQFKKRPGVLHVDSDRLKLDFSNWLSWQICEDELVMEVLPPTPMTSSLSEEEMFIQHGISDSQASDLEAFYSAALEVAVVAFGRGPVSEYPTRQEMSPVVVTALSYASVRAGDWHSARGARLLDQPLNDEVPEFSEVEEGTHGISRSYLFYDSSDLPLLEVKAFPRKIQILFKV